MLIRITLIRGNKYFGQFAKELALDVLYSVLSNVSIPKTLIFYLAFLQQFVGDGGDDPVVKMLAVGRIRHVNFFSYATDLRSCKPLRNI